jgi:hypothetical protein
VRAIFRAEIAEGEAIRKISAISAFSAVGFE